MCTRLFANNYKQRVRSVKQLRHVLVMLHVYVFSVLGQKQAQRPPQIRLRLFHMGWHDFAKEYITNIKPFPPTFSYKARPCRKRCSNMSQKIFFPYDETANSCGPLRMLENARKQMANCFFALNCDFRCQPQYSQDRVTNNLDFFRYLQHFTVSALFIRRWKPVFVLHQHSIIFFVPAQTRSNGVMKTFLCQMFCKPSIKVILFWLFFFPC